MVLLASDGQAKSVKGWRRLREKGGRLPLISIMSANQYRALMAANPQELQAGVFNEFDVNFDFLTSAWTVWPPNSERTSAEIRELTKTPYRPEEMRVFPNLDRLLTQAASGELKGKQTILIVPPQLKSLIQKLIMLRWSTKDPAAGDWNYKNQGLSFNKITDGENLSQGTVQDNYRAIRSSSFSRSTVIYADLEAIDRLGRPVPQGDTSSAFRLRDPINNRSGLIESETEDSDDQGGAEYGTDDRGNALSEELSEISEEIADLHSELNQIEDRLGRYALQGEAALDGDELEEVEERKKEIQEQLRALENRNMEIADEMQGVYNQGPVGAIQQAQQQAQNKTAEDKSAYPHMIYWVATEGRNVQFKKTKGWNVREAVDRDLATILVGTEEELVRLEASVGFEQKFFNIREHFDVVNLESPDSPTKYKLVEQLFERPEVKSLNFEFQLRDDNGLDPKSQLIHQFINRVDQLAYDQRIEKVAAFIRAYVALKNALTEDPSLRRSRMIDEFYLERLFTSVFPMPLNPKILPETDPLRRLRGIDQAARDLENAGYTGSIDLKRRVFENFLSQTRPTDSSRPIPNSVILFGGTSTGKTFLLDRLFKMLGLVQYVPNKANNDEADYIMIHMASVTEKKTNDPTKVSVDDLIAQIHDLLAGPKGARATIAFDDYHKATSQAVRERMAQFIQGLFEARNGMYTAQSRDGKRHKEIPIQNLNIYMTLNPTQDISQRRQFIDRHEGKELLKREVLAALSGHGWKPEESFLARWSDIINIEEFPRSAKVPGLVKRIRENASLTGQLVLVDPIVVDRLVDVFPEAHARELLAPASAALTSLPGSVREAPLYIVAPREETVDANELGAGLTQLGKLQAIVRGISQVDAIEDHEPRSLLALMGFMMRNFRLTVFNQLTLTAHMTDILRLDVRGQYSVLKTNFLIGLSTHVMDKPRIPTSELSIPLQEFSFFDRSDYEELTRLHGNLPTDPKFWPLDLEARARPEYLDLSRFLDGNVVDTVEPRTQRDVVLDTVERLRGIMSRAVRSYLRVPPDTNLTLLGRMSEDEIRQWFENLPEEDREAEFQQFSREIINVFYDFQNQMTSEDVTGDIEGFSPVFYEEVRLFAFLLDKAVTKLPWGAISQFTLNVSKQSRDLQLGTKPTFRDYVGVHQMSAFAIATPQFIQEMYQIAYHQADEGYRRSLPDMRSHVKCLDAFSNQGGND